MNAETILFRLRRFLLGLSALLFAGTFAELVFNNHTKEAVQLIPFFLCLLGVTVVGLAFVHPQRTTLILLRVSMILIGLGSLVGLYEHVENNVAFQFEILPSSSIIQLLNSALGGANPLLPPLILAVAAALAGAATYYHPALAAESLTITRAKRYMPD